METRRSVIKLVFRIRDILVRIRISDPYLWLTDPGPHPAVVSDPQNANKKYFFGLLLF